MTEARVVDPSNHNITWFKGALKDAEKFIRDHYPRQHVNPNEFVPEDGVAPAAVLVKDDGSKHHYNADTGEWTDMAPKNSEPTEPVDPAPSEPVDPAPAGFAGLT